MSIAARVDGISRSRWRDDSSSIQDPSLALVGNATIALLATNPQRDSQALEESEMRHRETVPARAVSLREGFAHPRHGSAVFAEDIGPSGRQGDDAGAVTSDGFARQSHNSRGRNIHNDHFSRSAILFEGNGQSHQPRLDHASDTTKGSFLSASPKRKPTGNELNKESFLSSHRRDHLGTLNPREEESCVTHRPTLLPRTVSTSRDIHDSSRFAISGTAFSREASAFALGASQPLYKEINNCTNIDLQSSTIVSSSTEQLEQARDGNCHSTEQSLSSQIMGYSSNHNIRGPTPSWRPVHNHRSSIPSDETDADKMESSTAHSTVSTSASAERKSNTNPNENDDDNTTIRSPDSSASNSPAMTPLQSQTVHPSMMGLNSSAIGTPSTVSTAQSWDAEASSGLYSETLQRMPEGYDNSLRFHRRVHSWDNSPRFYSGNRELGPNFSTPSPASFAQQQQRQQQSFVWGNPVTQQQRVASFREEDVQHQLSYPPLAPPSESHRWQPPVVQQQFRRSADPKLPFLPVRSIDGYVYHQGPPSNPHQPYQLQVNPQSRKPTIVQTTPDPGTSARSGNNVRNQRPQQSPQNRPPPGPATGGASSSRSSSEVLKTLLRKKACLYEPDTSRAVALVTWLVGRELALESGFFSRQQLQAGVHSCVGEKIQAGIITRTKVNRCMQIILNSCFHYIIPRPDGTEENGDSFRFIFGNEVDDDSKLTRMLPSPWNDLTVDREQILIASTADDVSKKGDQKGTTTPQSSPRHGPVEVAGSPGRESNDGDGDGKRAVLLCFNENVRCAEDVFRCHNGFIRDTAHASNLQLSANEWHVFFGSEAVGAPHIWDYIGIPVPYTDAEGPDHADALGVMTRVELGKFRTSWCSKRYEHDHNLCGFAHVSVNRGWLRRDPYTTHYTDEICPSVSSVPEKRIGPKFLVINECPHGLLCGHAHSMEEIQYHPRRYKSKTCPSISRGCISGDVCPNHHPVDSYRFIKRSDSRSGGRQQARQPQHQATSSAFKTFAPEPSPILYASPAPISKFEDHLSMPGLQSLYRRHCSVVRATVRKPGNSYCFYSCFGDDSGINESAASGPHKARVRLPSTTVPES
jgi:hypothetical protein